MKSLCNRRVSVWNPDTLKDIVRFVHEVHPVFVTKGFHFLKLIWTPDFLCVQNAPFKATSSFFNLFAISYLFAISSLFEINDP